VFDWKVTRNNVATKTVNFGIIYGVSAFGLSNQTSLPFSAALIEPTKPIQD
jgi:DNA polymerase I-like protein with 3'-5' exonuclease and polymerase domains